MSQEEKADVFCGKKTKSGRACIRFITGMLGYNGAFEHSRFGYLDLRNKEWRCWQHGNINEFGKHENDLLRRK